VKYLYVGAVGQ